MPLYTTEEKIRRKLIGRLQLDTTNIPLTPETVLGYGNSVSGQIVQPELLTDIIEEKEAYITLVLSQIYKTPLRLVSENTKSILSQITDGLVISDLLKIHFESSINPMSGSQDMGNMTSDMKRQAELLLAAVSASSNVFQPAQPGPMPSGYGMMEIQPLVLEGEILLSSTQKPDIVTRNYTFISKNLLMEKSKREYNFGEEGGCACEEPLGFRNRDYLN